MFRLYWQSSMPTTFSYGWFHHNFSTTYCKRHGNVYATLGCKQTFMESNPNVVITFSVSWDLEWLRQWIHYQNLKQPKYQAFWARLSRFGHLEPECLNPPLNQLLSDQNVSAHDTKAFLMIPWLLLFWHVFGSSGLHGSIFLKNRQFII